MAHVKPERVRHWSLIPLLRPFQRSSQDFILSSHFPLQAPDPPTRMSILPFSHSHYNISSFILWLFLCAVFVRRSWQLVAGIVSMYKREWKETLYVYFFNYTFSPKYRVNMNLVFFSFSSRPIYVFFFSNLRFLKWFLKIIRKWTIFTKYCHDHSPQRSFHSFAFFFRPYLRVYVYFLPLSINWSHLESTLLDSTLFPIKEMGSVWISTRLSM